MVKYYHEKQKATQITVRLEGNTQEYALSLLHIINNAREYPNTIAHVENNYDIINILPRVRFLHTTKHPDGYYILIISKP